MSSAAALPAATAKWLASQAPDVQAAIAGAVDMPTGQLAGFGPGGPTCNAIETLKLLAKRKVMLPSFDFFTTCYRLRCRCGNLALAIALTHYTSDSDLATFTDLAEAALFDEESDDDVLEFDECFRAGDPLEEVLAWLRDRAHQQRFGMLQAQQTRK